MSSPSPLQPGRFYHVYNRGVNGGDLFREKRNYRYFLEKYAHHVPSVVKTFAYALLPNHFHLLVEIRTCKPSSTGTDAVLPPKHVSRAFANLYSGYAKAINKAYGRSGSLFERPFQRIEVDSDRYFQHVIRYIHQNPARHGLVDDFRDWPYTSCASLQSRADTRLERQFVLDHFGGRESMRQAHRAEAPGEAAFVTPSFESTVEASLKGGQRPVRSGET